jgi:hypothetical protein
MLVADLNYTFGLWAIVGDPIMSQMHLNSTEKDEQSICRSENLALSSVFETLDHPGFVEHYFREE